MFYTLILESMYSSENESEIGSFLGKPSHTPRKNEDKESGFSLKIVTEKNLN